MSDIVQCYAFPAHFPGHQSEGMTLRDYFAGCALTGYSAVVGWRRCPFDRLLDKDKWLEQVQIHDAKYCYWMADAMLKEREGKP